MQINRPFLYAGILLLAIGAVVVAADLGAVDTAALADALRLWPLVPISIGVAIVLRRSQVSLGTGMLAAAVPGLVLGSGFGLIPRFVGDCGARGEPAIVSREGTFEGPPSVSIRIGCGALNVTTAPGNGWNLKAGSTAGRAPSLETAARSLTIEAPHDGAFLDAGRDTWALTLPASAIDELTVVSFANHSRLGLAGATIGRLELTANSSDVLVDASSASVLSLSGVVNVGLLSIRLSALSDLDASLRIGGGELQLCAPPDLGLRVTTHGQPGEFTVDGLAQTGTNWQSATYASATHRADLRVSATFGAVKINPIGGCR